MKLFTASVALLLAVLDIASAAPAKVHARQSDGTLTFFGAGPDPNSYTLSPSYTDGLNFTIGTYLAPLL